MLILGRKVGEGFIINEKFELNVVSINKGKVVLELKEEGKTVKPSVVVYYGEGSEQLFVDNKILSITVTNTTHTIVRLGFEAPKSVKITRKELLKNS